MPKFRKRPIVVEAMQFTGINAGDIVRWAKNDHVTNLEFGPKKYHAINIATVEGDMLATEGDWIIKGVNGEFYPCKPMIFAKTYEPFVETEEG